MPEPTYVDIYGQDDGFTPDACPIPIDGRDGVGIISISQVGSSNNVLITLTNGSQYTIAVPTLQGIQGIPGNNGTNGMNGTNGSTGATGATGATGSAGTNGTNGTNGSNGTNGLNIRSGSGVPSGGLGVNGDTYIDYLTFNYYTKISGSYVLQGNIKGANGTKTTIDNYGGSTPSISAIEGDLAIDNSNLAYYYYISGAWTPSGFIKPSNYITTNSGQTGLTGDKVTSGFWSFSNILTIATNTASLVLSTLGLGNVAGKLLIGNNRSGSLGEVNFWSIVGSSVSAKGGFHFSNLSNDGTIETDLLDINGDTKAITTYGRFVPGIIDPRMGIASLYLTIDTGFTEQLVSRTTYETAQDVAFGGIHSSNVTGIITKTIPLGFTMPNNRYGVALTPLNALSLGCYVTNKTTTTFDIVFPSSTTGDILFDYILSPRV